MVGCCVLGIACCPDAAPRPQVLRVRDELFLLLRRYKQGLQLDDLWPALRRMVRSRPGGFSPVTAGRLDKPDRTFQKIIDTAGYRNVKAFLEEQPEVVLTVRARCCSLLRCDSATQAPFADAARDSPTGRGLPHLRVADAGVPGRARATAGAAA